MRIISEQELKDILDKHNKWLNNCEGGERANLRSADLSLANLNSIDLSFANLSLANLHYANLRSANLHSANLSSANLRSTDLSFANLSSAYLSSADLSFANLYSANLNSADLGFANLSFAVGFKFVPIQIINTKYFITIFEDHVIWGCHKMTFEEVKDFKFTNCTTEWNEKEFNLNKKVITEMIRYYREEL